jgi:ribonuclease HI
MSIHQAVVWARDTALDLWQISQATRREKPQIELKWRPPEPGWVKVNADASFQSDSKVDTAASVVRDHQGAFRVAQARWYEQGLGACTMEASACRDALALAKQHGVQRVLLETDCMDLVNLWKKKEMQRYVVDPILKEIEDLSLAFHEFSFSYVNRVCNKFAHVLAK